MWIRDPTFFPLILCIENQTGDCDFSLYDSRWQQLSVQQTRNRNIYQLDVDICLPSKLIVKFQCAKSDTKLELRSLNLVGINVQKSKLLNCLEYKPDPEGSVERSWDYLQGLPSQKKTEWAHQGYVILDFFHPNPFAWHLYIGNNIQF